MLKMPKILKDLQDPHLNNQILIINSNSNNNNKLVLLWTNFPKFKVNNNSRTSNKYNKFKNKLKNLISKIKIYKIKNYPKKMNSNKKCIFLNKNKSCKWINNNKNINKKKNNYKKNMHNNKDVKIIFLFIFKLYIF